MDALRKGFEIVKILSHFGEAYIVYGINAEGSEIGIIIKSTIQWIIDNNIKLEETKLIENYIKD